jgi:predicted RNA-binding protein YlqC (UPF0109 family)
MKGGSGSVSLYNFKILNKYTPPNQKIHVINIDYTGSKDELLDNDDMPTPTCSEIMKQMISRTVSAPSQLKSEAVSPKETIHDTKVFMGIDKKDIGRVIGKAGSTISRLTTEHEVTITVGKWLEPLKEDRDSYVEKCQALLIAGRSDRVYKCHEALKTMLAADPPVKRKKNF